MFITNICANARVDRNFNLQNLLNEQTPLFISKKYNPRSFSGLIAKDGNVTFLIFYNGKIVITGGRNEQEMKNSVNELANYFNTKIIYFKFTNYCASIRINQKIKLESIAIKYPRISSYEIELFPALKMSYLKNKFTIHRNGVIFATGFKSKNEAKSKFRKIINLCKILSDI